MRAIGAGKVISVIFVTTAMLCLRLAAAAGQAVKAPAQKPAAAKAQPANESGIWFLAGRHGECAPLSILERKATGLKSVTSPNQLAEKLRAMGHKADIKEFNAGMRPAVEVRAPSAGIHVMFVRKEHCDRKPDEDKK